MESFDVARDTEGVELALEEVFEEDFVRSIVERESGTADRHTRQRMESAIPPRTLSPGYYRWALHLLALDNERRAGIVFGARDLAAIEASGLVAADRARGSFRRKHPECNLCGALQPNRFGRECCGCGVKFQRKGK